MSLLFARSSWGGITSERLLNNERSKRVSSRPYITADTAMRSSAVWACLRMRADMVSTTPLDVYRKINGIQVEAAPTPFLLDPAAQGWGIEDWLYSGQVELDRNGNNIGLILARDAMQYPAVVRLFPSDHVTVLGTGGDITGYRIGGTVYDPSEIWHERQYTVPGIPLGLSPVAYAAWSVGNFLSAQEFTQDWFGGGGASMPSGHLKNAQKTLEADEATKIKARFKASVESGDVFVSGNDWEFTPVPVSGTGAQFIESMQYGIGDIARFFGLPGDLIDAVSGASNVTYANVVQRNLQALIWYLQPVFERREAALSRALPRPRFVEFNTNSLLRMDPQTLVTTLGTQIDKRFLTPDEARALMNRPPLTKADKDLFLEVFPPKGLLPLLAPDGSVPEEGVPVA